MIIFYRYVFAHYIPLIAGFYGIYVRKFDPEVYYQWYVVVLLIITTALALVKIIIMVLRGVKDPIHYPQASAKVKFQPLKSNVIPVTY